jgi:phage shock protein E
MNFFKVVAVLIVFTITDIAVAADAIWIDVRSAEEFNAGHLPGSLNIVHTEIAGKIAAVTQDKNAEIQLYCRSGRRSGLAEAELKKLGFTNVHNAGGYEELKALQDAGAVNKEIKK